VNSDGGAEEIRTPDLLLAKETLYQLSHGPVTVRASFEAPSSGQHSFGVQILGPKNRGGRFWTRTRDLCLIRAVL
jgi:hypothetical protein